MAALIPCCCLYLKGGMESMAKGGRGLHGFLSVFFFFFVFQLFHHLIEKATSFEDKWVPKQCSYLHVGKTL